MNAATRVISPGRRQGRVTVPSSKSIAHRELIAAALSGVEPPVVRGWSKDLQATRECLRAMMAGESEWPCGESGTTLRLLEPIAHVMGWRGSFRCEGRLGQRPRLPFERKSRYVVPGGVSSQFVSGLLMALPMADWDSEIVIDGELQSASYVLLTENVLAASGIRVERSPRVMLDGRELSPLSWKVRGGQSYRIEGGRVVEGDWSQAAFFLAMGVEVDGLREDSDQGDRVVRGLLARIDRSAESTDGAVIDLRDCPDLYPALAAYAAARGRKAVFTGTERLRLKESDRLAAVADLIESVRRGETVDPHGDHRIAMAAAVMACYAKSPVTVADPGCVAKSYPGFWSDFDSLPCVKVG